MSASIKIKEIRQKLCLEQSEFAKMLSVNKSSVCNYECGRRNPRMPTIRKIMDIAKRNKIKVDVEDFLQL